jgi:hypothetical protein
MIWVYAICQPAEVDRLDGAGLAGAPLEAVGDGGLVAVISRHPAPPSVRVGAALAAHEQVIERLMDAGAVLPMRFGSRLPDVTTLRSALAARHTELLDALDSVRGRVEVGVRALRPGGAVPPKPRGDGTGRGYLRARLELRNRDEAAAAAIHAPLAAMAVADSRRPERAHDELLRGSYLVERSAVGEFRAAARRLQGEHAELAVLCTGPWPPYSFVDLPTLALPAA